MPIPKHKIIPSKATISAWKLSKYHSCIMDMVRDGVGSRAEIGAAMNGGLATPELVAGITTFFEKLKTKTI